jgi:D-sedoheptulose 7-phosphate isomerase
MGGKSPVEDLIRMRLLESADVKKNAIGLAEKISYLAEKIIECYRNGGKTIIFGNGGSAADAQHLAGELVGRFYYNRPMLDAIALTTNTSILTAIGNDYGFDEIFTRQLENLVKTNDVVIGISTSGKSTNILKALEFARSRGAFTAGMCGENDSPMINCCDVVINVPSKDTPRIQETHITIGHIICEAIESSLFPR